MMLWLDDVRPAPRGFDLVAKNYDECVRLLAEHDVEHASLDHDLALEHYAVASSSGYMGTDIPRASFREKTGYDVLLWMAENNRWPKSIVIHSLNSVGRADMMRFLKRHAPEGTEFSEKPYVVPMGGWSIDR